jgi:hypothetical protein
MLSIRLAAGLALALAVSPALAQAPAAQPNAENVLPRGNQGRLPAPAVDANAPPAAFIAAARQALATGKVAEAEESIEQAESRALTRAVKPSLADRPSQQPLVEQLTAARAALAAGDRLRATEILGQAQQNPQAQDKQE